MAAPLSVSGAEARGQLVTRAEALRQSGQLATDSAQILPAFVLGPESQRHVFGSPRPNSPQIRPTDFGGLQGASQSCDLISRGISLYTAFSASAVSNEARAQRRRVLGVTN